MKLRIPSVFIGAGDPKMSTLVVEAKFFIEAAKISEYVLTNRVRNDAKTMPETRVHAPFDP